jgi:uncharacterized protein YndB with AHSA1/START domain
VELMIDPALFCTSDDGVSARAIRVSQRVAAPPREVWPLWTTAEGLRSWFASDARMELAIGGPFELLFLDESRGNERGSEGCQVLGWLPERLLVFSWNAPPHLGVTRARRTWVVVQLVADGDGTLVEIEHVGWPVAAWEIEPQWPATFAYFDAAWPRVLDNLAQFVASRV